jgi:hypothetical protein
MAVNILLRRGTAAEWTASNPILLEGEIGLETDTKKLKAGDGLTVWASLPYITLTPAAAASLYAPIASPTFTGTVSLDTGASLVFEGTTANAFETTFAVADPTADRTLTLPDSTGTIATQEYATNEIGTHNSDTTSVHGIADTADLATKSYADTAVSTHSSDTTAVHGIADTADLATKSYADTAASTAVSTHGSDTTNVHGITDTAELATKAYADTAASTAVSTSLSTHSIDTVDVHGIADTANLATKSYADTAVSTHSSDTTAVHGITDTSLLVTTTGTQTLTNKTITTPSGLVKSDVGLGNVDNTADASKPVSTAQQTALDLKANLSGPTFTGTVSGITKSMVGLGNVDDTTDASKPVSTAQASAIATAKSEAIADATSQVNALLSGAPAALNTLDELAAALGDDANFASTVTTSLGLKAPLASPTFTGTVTLPAEGIVFSDGTQTKEAAPSRTPIIQKTASYTLSSLTERDSLIEVASASATTITIPLNSAVAYPVGTSIDILQTSTGQVTIAGDAGVTVNSTPGLKLRTTWSSCTLFKRATNTWVVYGDLTA